MQRFGWRAGALLLLAAAIACTHLEPPRTRVLAPLDPSLDRVVQVTTNRAREDVVASLEQAGFRVASDARETSIVLEVKVGVVRVRDPLCGAIQNLSYSVRQRGVRIAIIRGRGWTGPACTPNIYTQMNVALAHLFGPGREPPDAPSADRGR